MQTQELDEPTGPQSLLDRPVDSEGAYPVFERITRFTRTLNVLKKARPGCPVDGNGRKRFQCRSAGSSRICLGDHAHITAWPQNSTGVPMVVEAITNHVLRGTPDVINMFVNGTRVLECKSRECTDRARRPRHHRPCHGGRRPSWDGAVHIQCHCFSRKGGCRNPSAHHLSRDHLHLARSAGGLRVLGSGNKSLVRHASSLCLSGLSKVYRRPPQPSLKCSVGRPFAAALSRQFRALPHVAVSPAEHETTGPDGQTRAAKGAVTVDRPPYFGTSRAPGNTW